MELSIPSEESDSILAIPRRHFAEQGSWVATVTGRPIDPTSPHRQDPRRVGLSLAMRLDSTFSADRIFFSPEALLAVLNRDQRGEVYYLEDVVQAAAGLPQFSRAAPSPVRVLIRAARQHGVGLVLVSPVHEDHYLVRPLRDDRDSAIIVFDEVGYECLQREYRISPDDALAFAWYENEGGAEPGGGQVTMRFPVIAGRKVQGGVAPHPPPELLSRCQAMAEGYLEGLYREALNAFRGGR
ncbi:MAG: hypothetical protein WC277_07600 [Bacilli bacterium]